MKKQLIVAIAAGILSMGAMSAYAVESCKKCTETQELRQFNQETSNLTSTLKQKDSELRNLYTYDSIDIHKVSALEGQIKELKGKIDDAAQKYNIHSCNHG